MRVKAFEVVHVLIGIFSHLSEGYYLLFPPENDYVVQCWIVERVLRDNLRADERDQADGVQHPEHRGNIRTLHLYSLHLRCIQGNRSRKTGIFRPKSFVVS